MPDREPLELTTKLQSHRLWQSGAFGNKLRSWSTVDEWRESGHRGMVVLRMREGRGAGRCSYNVSPVLVQPALEQFVQSGVSLDAVMINEAAPDEHVVLQGEYLNDVVPDSSGEALWGYFFHSRHRSHMRDALREAPEETRGLSTDLMLRQVMTIASHEDWLALLERWPGHVLEVSVYDRCLGDLPNRNALVWEVRRY